MCVLTREYVYPGDCSVNDVQRNVYNPVEVFLCTERRPVGSYGWYEMCV